MTPPDPVQCFDAAAGPLAAELAALARTADAVRRLAAAGRILPNTVDAVRIKLTYHSNAIEGNTLSLRDTQLVLEGKTPGGEKALREVYEARNHARALTWVERHAAEPPDARQLLHVHGLVLADIDPAAAGRFRDTRVRISGHVPPGPHRFDKLIPALLALPERPGVDPLIAAAELHYNLAAVHPFADGNGRTARLMMNHCLLRRGYPYALLEVDRRGEYLATLDEANRGRAGPFVRLMIDATAAGARALAGDDA